MSAFVGKLAQLATRAIHSSEARHDAALFVGMLAATGIVGDFESGVPLTAAAVIAAVVTAGRRFLVARLAGK